MGVKVFLRQADSELSVSKNFKVKEFACKDLSDVILVDVDFVKDKLQVIRDRLGVVTVNSGYRNKDYNRSINGADNSYHCKGMAYDIRVRGKTPLEVARLAEEIGVNGIIVYDNFIHLDSRKSRYYAYKTKGTKRTVDSFIEDKESKVPMKISYKGVELIKSFEGLRLMAYKPIKTEKYNTIGYGHYGADVLDGMVITTDRADELLRQDIEKFERYVNSLNLELNQNQFDALVSFTYNLGNSNLKRLVANRTLEEIAKAMTLYVRSDGKVLRGLVKRREIEQSLFMRTD